MNARPKLAAPRQQLMSVAAESGALNVELIHAMEERDNALIADEILHGSMTGSFVYAFNVQGKEVSGVSVIGARHLAAMYGGMKHRIVATVEKRGAQFFYTTYPGEGGVQMSSTVQMIPEMEEDPDFYSVLVELTDTKKGNSIHVEKREMRYESRRDGSAYERPNYQIIAQSKAYRNGVLALVPQDVVIRFKQEAMRLGKSTDMTQSLIAQRREGALRFAAGKGVPLDREAVGALTFDQLSGLAEATKNGVEAFRSAADALGVLRGGAVEAADAAPAMIAQEAPAPAAPSGDDGAAEAEPVPAAERQQLKRQAKALFS